MTLLIVVFSTDALCIAPGIIFPETSVCIQIEGACGLELALGL